MAAATRSPDVLHLSFVVGGALRDLDGERLGRVDDLIVRLEGEEYPPVSGVVATVAGRQVFVPIAAIAEIAPGRVVPSVQRMDLQRFRRRPGEILLRKDVLDRQVINIDGARLVRANDIELLRLDGLYRVVGVDVSIRGLMRRVVPHAFAERIATATFLDWASIEPFTGHVPSVRLRVPHPKLARLHAAQLADLVETASHREGAEIIDAVRRDPDLEADLFEELEAQHQREFLEEREDEEIAALLARMEADDAVDLLLELPNERRESVVDLLPHVQGRRVRTLLGYAPATAGGLMSPEFVCLYGDATREETLERVRRSRVHADATAWIFALTGHKQLRGGAPLAEIVRGGDGARLADLVHPVPTVTPEAELEEVARLMADYDLTVVAVVGDGGQIVGVVTVDDVLELVLPEGWRRRFNLLGGD
jgi:CBS domain-containing protein